MCSMCGPPGAGGNKKLPSSWLLVFFKLLQVKAGATPNSTGRVPQCFHFLLGFLVIIVDPADPSPPLLFVLVCLLNSKAGVWQNSGCYIHKLFSRAPFFPLFISSSVVRPKTKQDRNSLLSLNNLGDNLILAYFHSIAIKYSSV